MQQSIWNYMSPADVIGYPVFLLIGIGAVITGAHMLFTVMIANDDKSVAVVAGTAVAGILSIVGGIGTAIAVMM